MSTPLAFAFADQRLELGRDALVMGILNVTPDSFSDGGAFFDPGRAVAHGLELVAEGAAFLDVGGESTRPGAPTVDTAEERRRVVPVIRALAAQTRVPISIDTWKAPVAAAALDAGAVIVNDISGLQRDADMLGVVARSAAGCIAMHMRGVPATMQTMTDYADLVGEICATFRDTLRRTAAAGIGAERLMLDPGIGFAKTATQNVELIAHLECFRALGRPVLAGPSRKSFIGTLLGGLPPEERAWGTAAAVACCVLAGADVVRVHDVRAMRQAAAIATAIRNASRSGSRTEAAVQGR